jgi:hypothetical protein
VDDLVQWLGEQLDEDERIARAVRVPHDWHQGPGDDPEWTDEEMVCMWPPEFHTPYERDKHWRGLTVEGPELAAHIAEHDPARALREIDAKRQLLTEVLSEPHFMSADDHWNTCPAIVDEDGVPVCLDESRAPGPCDCGREARVARRLHLLALPYAARPGYREDWRP